LDWLVVEETFHVRSHDAIFSKYADTNEDVLLYAKIESALATRIFKTSRIRRCAGANVEDKAS
jgi:hypothetical protein